MNRRKFLQYAVLLLLSSFTFTLAPSLASANGPVLAPGVSAVRIGYPIWKPVGFHLFSAPLGTAASGYEEFGQTMQALLPPPYHVPLPALGIGPGAPHAPPYTNELAEGVARMGFRESTLFRTSEFSNGNAVWLVWMTVPSIGTAGSSPDFASGRIIPNTLFPIHVFGADWHNGRQFSVLGEFDVPPLDDSLDPPFNVDGHSHFPVFMADNADFGPHNARLPGLYEYRIVMLDRLGNGWRIEVMFSLMQW